MPANKQAYRDAFDIRVALVGSRRNRRQASKAQETGKGRETHSGSAIRARIGLLKERLGVGGEREGFTVSPGPGMVFSGGKEESKEQRRRERGASERREVVGTEQGGERESDVYSSELLRCPHHVWRRRRAPATAEAPSASSHLSTYFDILPLFHTYTPTMSSLFGSSPGAPQRSSADVKSAVMQQLQQEAATNNARALIGVRHRVHRLAVQPSQGSS